MEDDKIQFADLEKVDKLFRNYYKVMRIYAMRFIYDRSIAENIVQDVFFEIWQRRDHIDFDGPVKSYLFQSVYNKCLNYLQSHTFTKQTTLENLPVDELEISHTSAFCEEPESLLMLDELENEIHQIISTLPPQCKQVFHLSRNEQLKNREIAEKLNISVKTVEKHISKALSELRLQLKGKELLLLIWLFNF